MKASGADVFVKALINLRVFERALNVLGQIARPYRNGNRVDLVFGAVDVFERILSTEFELFDTLEPTPRMNARHKDLGQLVGGHREQLRVCRISWASRHLEVRSTLRAG